jgi:hypothetical protein
MGLWLMKSGKVLPYNILTISPKNTDIAYWFAVGGAAAFCRQTTILDMLVWPGLFSA